MSRTMETVAQGTANLHDATGATVQNPAKVVKLAVLAPQWVSDKPIPLDMGGHLDCYRLVPVKETRKRWLGAAPEGARDTLIPDGWFDAWATGFAGCNALDAVGGGGDGA